MRQRRLKLAEDKDYLMDVLLHGTQQANAVAEQTLARVKEAMQQDFFTRKLSIHEKV
jgi:uncharacterized protein YfdQ (DUF2303 family)